MRPKNKQIKDTKNIYLQRLLAIKKKEEIEVV